MRVGSQGRHPSTSYCLRNLCVVHDFNSLNKVRLPKRIEFSSIHSEDASPVVCMRRDANTALNCDYLCNVADRHVRCLITPAARAQILAAHQGVVDGGSIT